MPGVAAWVRARLHLDAPERVRGFSALEAVRVTRRHDLPSQPAGYVGGASVKVERSTTAPR